jgi:CheY-like chemotaxis protein
VTEPLGELVEVIWSHDAWSCEHWDTTTGPVLILRYGREVALHRSVRGLQEVHNIARLWRDALSGGLSHILLPGLPALRYRRTTEDRRHIARGGRRAIDAAHAPGDAGATGHRRPRVAIVSDPETLDVLQAALREAGFDTIAVPARDVREGLLDLPALIRTENVRALVYDVGVPYRENWLAARQLQEQSAPALPPIIVTTANARGLDGFPEAAGVIEILGEPGDLAQLVAAVRAAVYRS